MLSSEVDWRRAPPALLQMRIGRLQIGEMHRRAGDEIALDEIAAKIAAGGEFGFRLDALGNDAGAEHMGGIDGVADEMALARAGFDAGDEMPVDLHIVHRLVAEQLQPVEADAEIVDRQLEAGKPQAFHQP